MVTEEKAYENLRQVDLKLLDLRVGLIEDFEELPMTKGAYVALININKDENQVASTDLKKYFEFDDLLDRTVVVACNLPRVMQDGVESNSKIMCALRDGKVELLKPPPKSLPGEKVFAPGYIQEKYWLIKQRKYDKIVVDLKVNSEKQAVYKDVPLQVEKREGFVTTDILDNCAINYV